MLDRIYHRPIALLDGSPMPGQLIAAGTRAAEIFSGGGGPELAQLDTLYHGIYDFAMISNGASNNTNAALRAGSQLMHFSVRGRNPAVHLLGEQIGSSHNILYEIAPVATEVGGKGLQITRIGMAIQEVGTIGDFGTGNIGYQPGPESPLHTGNADSAHVEIAMTFATLVAAHELYMNMRGFQL